MVKILHSEGFEVVLDVVYNHTAEGSHYTDYTGCGNTLNARLPRTLQRARRAGIPPYGQQRFV